MNVEDECYICHNFAGGGHNNLLRMTSHSNRPIYDLLGSISSIQVCDTSSPLCFDCLLLIESYDEHFTKAKQLQARLQSLLDDRLEQTVNIIKTEISIKTEENENDEDEIDGIAPELMARVDVREPASAKFECSTCFKSFSVKSKLFKHQEIHTTERNFTCQICLKSFKTSTCLRIHRRTHLPQPRVFCDLCNESFTKKHSFIRHYISKHTTRKDFLCSHCPKAFSSNPTLRHHLFTHSEDKKECCPICNARFHTKTKLRRHARTHAEHKEYSCPICFKEFTQKYNVNAHIKTVHSESRLEKPKKEFSCSICSQSFTRMQKLRQHLTQAHQVVEDSDMLS